MRTLLLAGVLAVAGLAIATPISITPALAQVGVDTAGRRKSGPAAALPRRIRSTLSRLWI
jgi:hypothetical protein